MNLRKRSCLFRGPKITKSKPPRLPTAWTTETSRGGLAKPKLKRIPGRTSQVMRRSTTLAHPLTAPHGPLKHLLSGELSGFHDRAPAKVLSCHRDGTGGPTKVGSFDMFLRSDSLMLRFHHCNFMFFFQLWYPNKLLSCMVRKMAAS